MSADKLVLGLDLNNLSQELSTALAAELINCLPPRKVITAQLEPVMSAALNQSIPLFVEATREAIEEALSDSQFRELYKQSVKNVLARKLGGEIASNMISASAREAAKALCQSAPFKEQLISLATEVTGGN
jgi:hypothetical protein